MYDYCTTVEELREAYLELMEHDLTALAWDTETNGLNPFAPDARLILVQVASPDGYTVMVDARYVPPDKLFAFVRLLFEQDSMHIFHKAQFDLRWLLRFGAVYGVQMPEHLYCSMLTERLLTAGKMAGCSLKAVSNRYLNVELDKTEQKSWLTLGDKEISQEQLTYAAGDVQGLFRIMLCQQNLLAEQGLKLVHRLEMAVLPVAVRAGLYGVEIDIVAWRQVIEDLTCRSAVLQGQLEKDLWPYLSAARRARGYFTDRAEWELALSEWEADAQAAYDAVLVQAQAEIESWQADYLVVKSNSIQKEAATWKRLYPKPTENRGEAQAAKRAWVATHPKPVLLDEAISLGSGPQKAAALLQLGVPLPETDTSRVKRRQDPGIAPVYQTGHTVLKKFAGEFPIIDRLIEWSGYAKLISSFGEAVLLKADAGNRLHPEFNTLGAEATGRFSCKNPNVQQIPLDSKFRECFIAGRGRKLVIFDYSQIELRVMAELAKENGMMWAFDNAVDLHSLNALKMFPHIQEALHITPASIEAMMEQSKTNPCILDTLKALLAEVKKHYELERKRAKTLSFGLIYGQTKYGLSEQWGVSVEEAQEIIEAYFAANPAIAAWLERTGTQGMSRLYVETPLGRKRYFHPLGEEIRRDKSLWRRYQARYKRAMTNQPVQGGAADITKMAMVRIHKALKAAGLDAELVMTVHDELAYEVAESAAEATAKIVRAEMIAAAQVVLKRCPVEVSGGISYVWVH